MGREPAPQKAASSESRSRWEVRPLSREDKLATVHIYEELLESFGPSPAALGWRSQITQRIRFEVLAQIGDLHEASVLDVGCGLGDLYEFLRARGLRCRYLGVDITPAMVAAAQKNHPEGNFALLDILTDPPAERYDYVFASGIFNMKISDNEGFVRSMLVRMFEICRRAVGANMLCRCAPRQDRALHYFNPAEMFLFARTITPLVALRHDYHLDDFTLYLYRE